jgi:hypothetical protein
MLAMFTKMVVNWAAGVQCQARLSYGIADGPICRRTKGHVRLHRGWYGHTRVWWF